MGVPASTRVGLSRRLLGETGGQAGLVVPVADEPDEETRKEPEPAEATRSGGDGAAGEAPSPDGGEAGEGSSEGPDFGDLTPEDLEVRAAELASEAEAAREEADEYLDRLRRLKADFDNYRKRKEDEVDRLRRAARDDLLEDLVEVLDSFDRALEQAEAESEEQGIRMIRKQFLGVLESDGVDRVHPEGEPFDPTRHEAVLREATVEAEEGTVLDVLEPGYVRGETVLRPARVKVASAPEVETGDGA